MYDKFNHQSIPSEFSIEHITNIHFNIYINILYVILNVIGTCLNRGGQFLKVFESLKRI